MALDSLSADPNDWVSPGYVAQGAKGPNTSSARQHIISLASGSAKKGPWSKSPFVGELHRC